MVTNKRYDLNFIEDLLSLYNYKAGLRTYGIIITPQKEMTILLGCLNVSVQTRIMIYMISIIRI